MEVSELAGKTVKIKTEANTIGGAEIRIEDWWINIAGSSWMFQQGNPACMIYAMRTGTGGLDIPSDDEVLYGKIGGLGHLVHISEIEMPI